MLVDRGGGDPCLDVLVQKGHTPDNWVTNQLIYVSVILPTCRHANVKRHNISFSGDGDPLLNVLNAKR